MGGVCGTHVGEMCVKDTDKKKPEWKKQLLEYRRRWVDNIKMVLQERGRDIEE